MAMRASPEDLEFWWTARWRSLRRMENKQTAHWSYPEILEFLQIDRWTSLCRTEIWWMARVVSLYRTRVRRCSTPEDLKIW